MFLGIDKLTGGRFVPSVPTMLNVMRIDNFIGRIVAPLGIRGGSLTVTGIKSDNGRGSTTQSGRTT